MSSIKKLELDKIVKGLKRDYQLYIFLIPAIAFIIIFAYIPMYGVTLAFKEYNPMKGILGSPWVGFKHFQIFFNSYSSKIVIKNTIFISLYGLIAGFPLPIILALMLHHVPSKKLKRTVQFTTYAPYFISMVVLVGIINVFFASDVGIVNVFREVLGLESIFFIGEVKYFRHLYVWSGIWQGIGWSSIIYIAALSGVDPTLYEAAIVDGANKFKRILYIDLPYIMPTAIILLILSVGNIMSVGFEKVFLMQNETNRSVSEIISTYVYKVGLLQSNFELGVAIGLFNSVINCILLVTVNRIAKKVQNVSLF